MSPAASIAVLSSGNFVDDELHEAAQHVIKYYETMHGEIDVQLRLAYTETTILSFLVAFDEFWDQGIRVFLVGGGESEPINALCQHLKHTAKQALVISPTAFKPNLECPQLISLYPDHGALIAAEMVRIKQNGITRIIPVVTDEEMDKVSQLMLEGSTQELEVEYPIKIQLQNTSLLHLQEKIRKYPRAAIWLSLGGNLLQLFPDIGNIIQGHLVMVHSHPAHLSELLKNPDTRKIAEINAICTTEWAGSSEVNTVARRHLLSSLHQKNPLVGALAYDAATIAISMLSRHLISNKPLIKSEIDDEVLQECVTKPDHVPSSTVSGFIVWKRLVMERLVGEIFLQETPWLLEGSSKIARMKDKPWSIVQQSHSPVHLVTKEEILTLANKGKCDNELWVKVTAHDPLSHRPITKSWATTAFPRILLLPNSSPNGFILQTWCKMVHETRTVELGCRGAASHNESPVCVTVSEGSGRRRSVRSIVTRYGYPMRRKKYPIRRQQQPGFFSSTFDNLKTFFNHDDFKGMIPQIGGCLGTTGGCSFCFIYLIFNDVAVHPGVCYGACSFLVGASCTTLLAKGIQNHADHTVICSELFTQGRIPLLSYLADASYGFRLAARNPRALRGYQTIAAPLVAIMQVSPAVTSVVEVIAQPWMRHMEYEEGLRPEDDVFGRTITTFGLPFCCFVATFLDHIDTITLIALVALLRRVKTRYL